MSSNRSDAELVHAVLNEDSSSYGHLVRRYQDVLFRHALGMVGDSDVAADMVQDAFIAGYSRLAQCRNAHKFGGWMFNIVRNCCLDHLKSPRNHTAELGDRAVTHGGSTPDEVLAAESLEAEIRRALDSLPPLLREAFLLKHVEECSYDEMAERLGATRSALKMRVKRARAQLAVALSDMATVA